MPPKNALPNIEPGIHSHFCHCRKCTPRMPGERSLWNPSPPVLITGALIAGLAIAINYLTQF